MLRVRLGYRLRRLGRCGFLVAARERENRVCRVAIVRRRSPRERGARYVEYGANVSLLTKIAIKGARHFVGRIAGHYFDELVTPMCA